MSKRIGGFLLGAVVLAAVPAAADDTVSESWLRKVWTHGTTEAANEVVGTRAGLSFKLVPPPVNDTPPPVGDMPHVFVLGGPVLGRVQVLELGSQPPPVNDLPPGPVAVRVRLLPPGPTAPAKVELQLLDMDDVVLLGPTGQPAALCLSNGGQ